MDPDGAVHENLHRVNLQVLRVELTAEALELLQPLFGLPRRRDHIAAVDINGKLSLLVHLTKSGVDPLMEGGTLRNTGIKDRVHTGIQGEVDPAGQRRVDLLIAQIHCAVENNRHRSRAFNDFSGQVSVFSLIITESGNRVRCVVRNSVAGQKPGVHPDAMAFHFLDLKLAVRADRVKILLHKLFAVERLLLHGKSVTLQTGLFPDHLRHDVQGFLLSAANDEPVDRCVLKADGPGHVGMAVYYAGHDEFSFKIRDLSLILRKAVLIANIQELSILHNKRAGQRFFLIRSEYFCVLDDPVRRNPICITYTTAAYA